MRHAAGELADRIHLLRLRQRAFDLPALGDVLSRSRDMPDDPIGIDHRAPFAENHALFTVRERDPDLDRIAFPAGRQSREPVRSRLDVGGMNAGSYVLAVRLEVERESEYAIELLGPG